MRPTLSEVIVTVALSYEGKREIKNNAGFVDKKMEAAMLERGWQRGQAWCAYFAELVWSIAYEDFAAVRKTIDANFSGLAIQTFRNFKAHEEKLKRENRTPFFRTSTAPALGAVAIWLHGKGPSGHAGIVVQVNRDGTFVTVEGNTNDDGSREGYEVARKTRRLNLPYTANGLNLAGFILPYEPTD